MSKNKGKTTLTKYFIKGLHCASCELIIEKKLKKIEDVVSADVSLSKGTLLVVTKGNDSYSPEAFNDYFGEDGYTFSSKPFGVKKTGVVTACSVDSDESDTGSNKYQPFLIAGLFLMGFYILQKTGLSSLISVNASSTLPVFFLFGLLAGVLIEDGGAVGGSVKGFSFFSAQPLVIPNIDKKTIENRIIRFIDFY